jgi:hypothetical protein
MVHDRLRDFPARVDLWAERVSAAFRTDKALVARIRHSDGRGIRGVGYVAAGGGRVVMVHPSSVLAENAARKTDVESSDRPIRFVIAACLLLTGCLARCDEFPPVHVAPDRHWSNDATFPDPPPTLSEDEGIRPRKHAFDQPH